MTNIASVLGAVAVALGALAAVVVLGIHGTISGEATAAIVGSIVTGGFALAATATGAHTVTRALKDQ